MNTDPVFAERPDINTDPVFAEGPNADPVFFLVCKRTLFFAVGPDSELVFLGGQ